MGVTAEVDSRSGGRRPATVDEASARPALRAQVTPARIGRVLCGVPVAIALVAGWLHRWTYDDGFIYFRVVQQIRAGNGPVFNTGERVEVATGTVWVWLLAVSDLVVPIRLEWLAVVIGLAATAVGVVLAMMGAARLAGAVAPEAPTVIPVGAVVFVSVAATWIWSTAGMETGLTFAWLGCCWWLLTRWATGGVREVPVWGAVVLGAGWLIRPDMVLYSAAFFVAVVGHGWWRGRRRAAVATGLWMLALPVLYQVFRMGYYGLLVPNTAIAKEGGAANWPRGWRYLADFVRPYWLWFPAVLVVVGGYVPLLAELARRRLRRAALVVVLVAGCASLHTLYVVRVGGDYLHARLLLPAFFAVCVPVAVLPAVRRHVIALAVVPWAVMAMLFLRPAQYDDWRVGDVVLPQGRSGMVTIDDVGWGDGGPQRAWYQGPGFYRQVSLVHRVIEPGVELRSDLPPSVGALGGIGAVGYALGPDFHILDNYGLAEPVTAHFEHELPGGVVRLAGHEKRAPAEWVAAHVAAVGSPVEEASFQVNPEGPVTRSGAEFAEAVDAARVALTCPPIQRRLDSVTAPLTVGRFARNLVDSFSNTRLRVPVDPVEAVARLCPP